MSIIVNNDTANEIQWLTIIVCVELDIDYNEENPCTMSSGMDVKSSPKPTYKCKWTCFDNIQKIKRS